MKQLDIINTYNYTLYLAHYIPHLEQLETMRNLGEITDMSLLEVSHYLAPEVEMESFQEMGNLSFSNEIEDGWMTRIVTQFSWGTKTNPPFVHSSDALNSVAATMGKLGK